MADRFAAMEPKHIDFLERQRVFFTATAAAGTRVNVSPRPVADLRVLGPDRVIYLDMTGSGAETAAHLRADGRMTMMVCAFEGPPRILRLYGRGRSHLAGSADYGRLLAAHFPGDGRVGKRQIVELAVDLVQTSCGYGVPLFDYQGERANLERWAEARGEAGIRDHWAEKNRVSLDGLPTGIGE